MMMTDLNKKNIEKKQNKYYELQIIQKLFFKWLNDEVLDLKSMPLLVLLLCYCDHFQRFTDELPYARPPHAMTYHSFTSFAQVMVMTLREQKQMTLVIVNDATTESLTDLTTMSIEILCVGMTDDFPMNLFYSANQILLQSNDDENDDDDDDDSDEVCAFFIVLAKL